MTQTDLKEQYIEKARMRLKELRVPVSEETFATYLYVAKELPEAELATDRHELDNGSPTLPIACAIMASVGRSTPSLINNPQFFTPAQLAIYDAGTELSEAIWKGRGDHVIGSCERTLAWKLAGVTGEQAAKQLVRDVTSVYMEVRAELTGQQVTPKGAVVS